MPEAVSSRYASALVDSVVHTHMDPKQALAELLTFEELMKGSAELRNVLLSPAVPSSRKRAVVTRIGEMASLSRLIRNFLFVLIDRRRIHLLGEMRKAFEAVLNERLGIARAEVTSAVALTREQQSALEAELTRVTGKQIQVHYATDETLLGGVVTRIGSTVFDGSVRTRLNALRERLVSR
jgi:F-type H+-transporting ATPase subunit delta